MGIVDLCALRSRAGRKRLEKLLRRGDNLLDPKVLAKTARILAAVRARGDAALLRAVAKFEGSEADDGGRAAAADRPGRRAAPAGRLHRGLRTGAGQRRALPPEAIRPRLRPRRRRHRDPPAAGGHPPGRPLRAGRPRRLPVDLDDDGGAGAGRRGGRDRGSHPAAGLRRQSGPALGAAPPRGRRGLGLRRRPRDRRLRLRHRDGGAGRQDRRAGQRLGHRRQIPRFAARRHRLAGRAERGA